jgi:hypothetical protein
MQSRTVFACHASRDREGEHPPASWPTAHSLEAPGLSYAVDTVTGFAPFEEPKEAMADRGPDGRMVPTLRNLWCVRGDVSSQSIEGV